MDRLAQLTLELSVVLDELHKEAARRNVRELMAPLAWLDEANGWLNLELQHSRGHSRGDAAPFVYIPVELRK